MNTSVAFVPDHLGRSPADPWRRAALLALGAVLLVASQMRGAAGLLAWLAPAPWLHYLRQTHGWRSRLLFSAVLVGGWTATTLKIVTAPLPVGFCLFGVGIAIFSLAGYLAWDFARRRTSEGLATLVFPAAMAVLEWLQSLTPLGTWGGAIYTQVDDLPFLQVASLVGGVGGGFFVNWVAAGVESAWADRWGRPRGGVERILLRGWLPLIGVALLHVGGTWRLQRPFPGASIQAAAIGTSATFGASPTIPDAPEQARIVDSMLEDSRRAARNGAQIAVWTEAAALVLPEEEPAFVKRAAATAADASIHIVAAYILLTRRDPLNYENKFVWLTPAGTVDHAYLKHHPVPGEPAPAGTSSTRIVEIGPVRASGAICYDYDFPALALAHGQRDVGLVALPASDWRGIDPLHTQMAAVRAIEAGLSIVRSTRFGLSAAIDGHGRLRAWHSSFEGGDRVLMATLPAIRVQTIYGSLGDWPMLGFAVVLLLVLAHGMTRAPHRERARKEWARNTGGPSR